MAFCAPDPAPVALASGSTPRPKAREVIIIGRILMRTACAAAWTMDSPFSCSSFANSTIKIAFLLTKPMVVSKPTWKYTSLFMPKAPVIPSAPITPSGTTKMTAIGIDQLSYRAAKHRNTIKIDSV